MSDDAAYTLNTKGLDKLLKAFKGKLPVARVGILGAKNARSQGKARSNATVGAAHEFGTESVPQRSFLRIPIADHLNQYLEKAGAFKPEVLKEVVSEGTLVPWLKKIGIVAEAVVLDGFNTGGFGRWWPLSQKTVQRKKNNQILVETQQLRNSITSDVIE